MIFLIDSVLSDEPGLLESEVGGVSSDTRHPYYVEQGFKSYLLDSENKISLIK